MMATSQNVNDLQLPQSKVKTIMQCHEDVETVDPEPVYVVTKLIELFLAELAKKAYKKCNNNLLEYKHLADAVHEDHTLYFLREMIPQKITVRQYKEMMAKKAAKLRDSYESDDDDSGDESESSDNDSESSDDESEISGDESKSSEDEGTEESSSELKTEEKETSIVV